MQTCPRRMELAGPWQRIENIDRWDRIGEDLRCSYCGSAHPESALAFLRRVDGLDRWVEISKKRHKLTLRSAAQRSGAARFYFVHAWPYESFFDEVNRAIELSYDHSNERRYRDMAAS